MPVAKVEESEPAQPIVDGDNNHVGFLSINNIGQFWAKTKAKARPRTRT